MLQKKAEQKVQENFPNALDAKDTSIKYLGQLQNNSGIDVSRMLMATSLCSDDINMPSTTFFNVLFGPFIMGGLGGIPFAGITGMTAFAHHIPDEGTGFIFYGPHIGITLEGTLGKMFRPRQDRATNSCGALMLALSRMLENRAYEPTASEADYQQYKLEESLMPYKEEILDAANRELAITEATYKVIDKKVHEYVEAAKAEFHGNRVILLGGIIINTDPGLDDYFDARNFEIIGTK